MKEDVVQKNPGERHENGAVVKKDDIKSFEHCKSKADQGDATARFELGLRYYHGKGVVKDDYKAVKYFKLSAEQGNVKAQINLGVMYCKGEGNWWGVDYSEVFKYFKQGADQGDATAQKNLGSMYQCGDGVWGNYDKAAEYFKLSADQGNVVAKQELLSLFDSSQSTNLSGSKFETYKYLSALIQNEKNVQAGNILIKRVGTDSKEDLLEICTNLPITELLNPELNMMFRSIKHREGGKDIIDKAIKKKIYPGIFGLNEFNKSQGGIIPKEIKHLIIGDMTQSLLADWVKSGRRSFNLLQNRAAGQATGNIVAEKENKQSTSCIMM